MVAHRMEAQDRITSDLGSMKDNATQVLTQLNVKHVHHYQ